MIYAGPSLADDIVGLTKVDAGTNDVTEVTMPFVPIGEGLPSDFISGNFMGDGSPLSDRLYVYSAATGLMTNAFYSAWGWLDPATLSNSCMTAARGDTLYFARTDGDPISFSLFGRVGFSALSYPRFSYFSVDPQGAFADMEIATGGRPVDLLSTYSSTTNPPVSGWSHVARDMSAAEALAFRDELPLALSSKFYLAADASLDTDGDGIPDALESRVYGTSPFLADTDGDGIPDGVELAWGTNPLVAAPASAVLFSETFERPAVSLGPINGQNGWTTQSGRANAVAADPHGGDAALEISQGENDESTTVSHDFTASDSNIVWLDLWVSASSTDIALPSQEDVALIAFDYEMHPVLSDGPSVVTNTYVTAIDDTWTRCTAMVDYGNRTWDFYLDGVLVNSGLAIGAAAVRPSRLAFVGRAGKADDIHIGTERPLGLSSDGDALPDEWEFAAFGTLARDGSGDFDSDGISDAAEFAAGTDPAASDRPSGGNGLFAEFFRTTGGLSDIPDFDSLMASSSAVVETIDFPTTPWPAGSPAPGDKFACRVTGYVCIAERGRYTFFVTADDGVRLSVDGQVVVSDPAPHSARTTLATVELGVGWHEVEILYYENTGSEVLKLEWSGPGIAREVIPASRLCHQSLDVPPTGFASGLDASYYALNYSPSSMPNFGSHSPACRTTTSVIDFTSTSGAFAGAPQEMTERFGALYEGFLFVPKSGVYDLKLTSDDGSRLWLDGEIAVNHDGAHSMTTKGASVPLSRGLHAFRLEYFEISGVAGLQLSWALQGFASEIIPARYFVRLVADAVPDTDRDGMPDWWEEMHGLNLADASDAALDPDGDGLSNLGEFLAGTDPHCADTDGDGMPDGWEAANGTSAFISDAISDLDSDGLVNIDEYLSGANPKSSDTDGDGLSDYDETSQLGTDPASPDSVSIGGQISAPLSGCGVSFAVAEPQAFAVDASLLNQWCDYGKNKRPLAKYNRIVFRVDGHFVASRDVPFSVDGVVHALFYTPVLPAGQHSVSFEWCHPDFRARAELVAVSVNAVHGVDFEDVVRNRNPVPDCCVVSRVSPAFVEGDAVFPWLVSSAGLTVRPSGGRSWYVDVPLSAQGDTEVPLVFEGLVSTNLTVAWESTDLFASPTGMTIRAGSKLLFAGCPQSVQDGEVEVFTNGVSACSYACGSSAELAFDGSGSFNVQARWTSEDGSESETSESIQVRSVAGSFPESEPACMAGQWREWHCPGLSTNIAFSTDLYTAISQEPNGSVRLKVDDTRGERFVAARLFDGGPVLDVARIAPMWAVDSYGNVAYRIRSTEETDTCRCFMRQYGASDDVEFRLRPYTSSVTLPDFSLERRIRATDFDECGVAFFDLVKAKEMSAACHTVEVYQNGVRIGEAVYGNATRPPEIR